ncbi:MAG: alpha/beta fold hydrolase [Myxococcota bacterium]
MNSRRRFLAGTAAAGAALGLGWMGGRRDLDEAVRDSRFHPDGILGQGESARLWYRYSFIGQPVMDTQLLFILGLASAGLTDIGEVLDTATRISAADERSWFDAWYATAERVAAYGEDALARGHKTSAASHFLRAGAYYRAGLIRYADRTDPRLVEATRRTLALHDRALAMRGYDSRQLEIPYGGSALVGRMHYAPGVDRAPTMVLHQGLHAWPEDTMWVIDGALERGYHVLSFHGPGQGASLRLHGHAFRPDWEAAVAPVVDLVARDLRCDAARITLMGLSFGGYLAGRAAAHEPRLAALVVNPGVLSWADSMLRHFEEIPGIMALHRNGPAAFDAAISAASVAMPDARWYFDDVTWKHGVDSPHALIDELRRYENRDGASQIRCKTLIMDGTAEDATPGESQRLYAALTCEKRLMTFDPSTAAQVHCQGGSQLLAKAWLFDWMDTEVAA